MAYATPSDVAARNKARILGQGQNPTASDVAGYITTVAADLDALLVNKGYAVPIPTSATGAYALMASLNILGALVLTEEASPTPSPNLDRLRQDWEAAKKRLEEAKTVMDAPMNVQRSEVRGPWLTYTPSGEVFDPLFGNRQGDPIGNPADPYFSRQQRF